VPGGKPGIAPVLIAWFNGSVVTRRVSLKGCTLLILLSRASWRKVRPGFRFFFSLRIGRDVTSMGMPRRLRIQYPDAIYHLMACGNGRQDIVRDDHDRQRLVAGLARAMLRCSWRVYAFVIRPRSARTLPRG